MWVCVCVWHWKSLNPSGRAELCRPAWNCSRPNVLRSPKMLTPSLKRPRCRALANMCGCNSILGTSYVMAYGSIHVPTSHQFHRMVQCANFIPIFQSMMEARYSSLYCSLVCIFKAACGYISKCPFLGPKMLLKGGKRTPYFETPLFAHCIISCDFPTLFPIHLCIKTQTHYI